jgi:hypothetical protein
VTGRPDRAGRTRKGFISAVGRVWPWVAAPAALLAFLYHPLLRGEVLAARDLFRLFIPKGAFLLEAFGRGEVPLWIPYERLGQPFLATLQTRVLSPPALFALALFGAERGPTVEIVLLAALSAWGTALAARALGASRFGALVSACAFGLGPMTTQLSDQLHTFAALAWSGFIATAAIRLGRELTARRIAALAGFGALSFAAGSPETTLWQCVLATILVVGRARRRRIRRVLASSAAVGWSVALAAAALLPALEFAMNSTRTAEVAGRLQWAASPVTFLAAGWLNADLPRPAYWGAGEQGLLPSVFLGSLVVALSLAAIPQRRFRHLIVFGAVCVFLSLGSHFAPSAAVLQLPPLSFFRYPVKYLPGFAFTVCLLAGPGLDRWAAALRVRRPRRIWTGAVIAAATALIVFAGPITRLLQMREGATLGLMWTAMFIGGGIIAALLGNPSSPQPRAGICALVLLELLASHAFVSQVAWADARRLSAPSPYAGELRRLGGRISTRAEVDDARVGSMEQVEDSRQRLVKLRFIEERLTAVEGYSALEPAKIDAIVRDAPPSVLGWLSVRWVIADDPPSPGAAPAMSVPGLPAVYELPAVPRTYIAHDARIVADAEALDAMHAPPVAGAPLVFLAEGPPFDVIPPPDCESSARIVREGANFVEVEARACAPAWVVLMDTHFPGWSATVDGRPAPILRANLVGRAVVVPPGTHTVAFRYRPRSFLIGAVISLAALIAALAALWWPRRSGSGDLR